MIGIYQVSLGLLKPSQFEPAVLSEENHEKQTEQGKENDCQYDFLALIHVGRIFPVIIRMTALNSGILTAYARAP